MNRPLARRFLLSWMLLGNLCSSRAFTVEPFSPRWHCSGENVRTKLPLAAVPSSDPRDDDRSNLEWSVPSRSTRRAFLLSSAAATIAAATASTRPARAEVVTDDTETASITTAATSPPPVTTTPATCDATVSVWQRDNRIIYLLGTAHISELSATLAGQLVRDTHPSAVFVELDLRRVAGGAAVPVQKDGIVSTRLAVDPGASPNSRVVIPQVTPVSERSSSVISLADSSLTSTTAGASSSSSTALSATATPLAESSSSPAAQSKPGWFRRTLTDWGAAIVGKAIRSLYSNLGQAGFSPGEEFVMAIKEGQAIGSDIVLGDQDVQITLRRLSQALAVTDLNALTNPDSDLEKSMAELFGSSTGQSMQDASEKTPAEMKQELAAYVEAMKSRDSVRKIMGELQQVAPALVQVMLTERDTYMATGLDSLQNYQIITAVMGIAHQDGVERNLQSFGWKPVVLNCALAKPVTTA